MHRFCLITVSEYIPCRNAENSTSNSSNGNEALANALFETLNFRMKSKAFHSSLLSSWLKNQNENLSHENIPLVSVFSQDLTQ
jgi:hypothetical protein